MVRKLWPGRVGRTTDIGAEKLVALLAKETSNGAWTAVSTRRADIPTRGLRSRSRSGCNTNRVLDGSVDIDQVVDVESYLEAGNTRIRDLYCFSTLWTR